MRPGKSYLIHAGDWHTFVGRVVEKIGPQTYEVELVSKIRNTNNGDCWHQLAAGDARLREECDYAHYETIMVIPLAIAAFEWVGKLPQEVERATSS